MTEDPAVTAIQIRIRRSYRLMRLLKRRGFSERDAIRVAIALHQLEPRRWASIDATPPNSWGEDCL